MNTITLNLTFPEDVYVALQSSGLNREQIETQANRDVAIQLYAEGRLSLGKAARMANLPIASFWAALVERGVPVFTYTEEDYQEELPLIQELKAKLT